VQTAWFYLGQVPWIWMLAYSLCTFVRPIWISWVILAATIVCWTLTLVRNIGRYSESQRRISESLLNMHAIIAMEKLKKPKR